jgi:hypothetical protein
MSPKTTPVAIRTSFPVPPCADDDTTEELSGRESVTEFAADNM